MKTFPDMFAEDEDRERVLSEVLRSPDAVAGTTLVAYVERATLAVTAVRSLPTPDAVLDAESCFDPELIHQLNGTLHDVACDSVPDRPWTGDGWGPITGDLLTLVCREGESVITPTESQFFWGWRYSNHLTSAFDGEVYAVTPTGWVSLYGQLSGEQPTLPGTGASIPASPVSAPAVEEAERLLTNTSAALLGPNRNECLLCYVHRMLDEFGCDGQLRFAAHYRELRAPRATGLERRLERVGGFCDCEIFLNGYDLFPPHWLPEVVSEEGELTDATWPDPLPACRGVRAGSTQPCSLWWRRRRW